MKKILSITLALLLSFSCLADVNAEDFSKNEDKYITLCSSSTLTNKDKKTCQNFNSYLKKKNKNLKSELEKTKNNLNKTNESINQVKDEIETLNNKIVSLEKQIEYYKQLITKYEKEIEEKEELMKERLYSSQALYNSSSLQNYLYESSSITELASRISSIEQLTEYETDLANEIKSKKEEVTNQKNELTKTQENLTEQKKQAKAKQDEYITLYTKQQNQIKENQAQQAKISASQKKVDAALEALFERDKASTTSYSGTVSGNSTVGKNIANKALSKLGTRYYWGATGPNYFDCSGLVYWAHNQCGVKISRLTAAGYSNSGKKVTRSQLQAGDVITFSYGSGVAHIGIYLGNDKFVHASGRGSSTVGQYANQCVKVSTLSGRWQGFVHNYRRLY